MEKSGSFEAISDQSCIENESFHLERLFQDENEDSLNQSKKVIDLFEKGISTPWFMKLGTPNGFILTVINLQSFLHS